MLLHPLSHTYKHTHTHIHTPAQTPYHASEHTYVPVHTCTGIYIHTCAHAPAYTGSAPAVCFSGSLHYSFDIIISMYHKSDKQWEKWKCLRDCENCACISQCSHCIDSRSIHIFWILQIFFKTKNQGTHTQRYKTLTPIHSHILLLLLLLLLQVLLRYPERPSVRARPYSRE